MRRLTVLAFLTLLVAACGEPATEEEKVREAVLALTQAQVDGDHDEVCSLMTAQVKRALAADEKTRTCEDAVERILGRLSEQEIDELQKTKVTEVTFDGDYALARVSKDELIPMYRVDGEWLLGDGS